ncbi:acetyl-CoA synthetase-like protein [Aspergillus carlsbadensis]|nr:acetyl-CoA synthetase-like protein [Aspergillus carlsbadensis]
MGFNDASGFNERAQLLPHIIDNYAAVKPDAIYAEYTVSPTSYENGYRPITFKAFANAINGIAHWLVEQLGPGNGEILAYLGPNDLRYPALVLGAVKAGYCMFFTSPRNSVAAHSSLLTRLNCTKFLAPVPRPPPVTAILEAHTIDVLDVPSIDTLLDQDHPHFEFTKTYTEASGERLAVVHTSGSTGIPKPIFWTHESACTHMRATDLDPPEGFESLSRWPFGKRMFLVPPPFHAAGLAYSLFITTPFGTTIIFPSSGGLPTAAGLVEARKKTRIDLLLGVPSIIEELAQNSELLDYCSEHLEGLMYCGGDLPQSIGDVVASKIPLVNAYGASEIGMLNTIRSKTNRDPLKDWRYLHINPRMGAELRHVANEEYELVLVRKPDTEAHQFVFTVFPEKQEYHTNDLYVRHPDPNKPDLWRWTARADDVIVFLNGEKTNPVSMEQHIAASNPEVSAALVAGARRFQASLLVELQDKDKELDVTARGAMMEKLWPSIEEANAVCPAHARISKSHILFTKPGKPMLRAGKGTVQRAGTLSLYGAELDSLYADADKLAQADSEHSGPCRVDDPQIIGEYIRQTIVSITGWGEDKLTTDSANWFHLGFDSLQAISATRTLRRGLGLPELSPSTIYLHPSANELTEAVLRMHKQQEESAEATKIAQLNQRDQLLEELAAKIQPPVQRSHPPTVENHTVILTGSTGNLGTYILDALVKSPSVTHIHCLNRKADAINVQRQKSEAYSLNIDLSRVTFSTADLSQPDFGLRPDVLDTLQQSATLIIHNAWAVNFNLSLPSFRPNLDSVVNLVNFSAQAPKAPHLFFISSISSTMGHRATNGLTPEAVIRTTAPAPNGYADSKYLAELLLDQAVKQGTLSHASFARVGQVAGSLRSRGLWNKAEWFPSLVISSLHVGALPDTLGPAMDRVDWMPIDLLADVLVGLALGGRGTGSDSGSGEVNVYHPVNIHPLSWEAIRPMAVDPLSKTAGKTVEIVSSHEWLKRVREDVERTGSAPGLSEGELQSVLAKNPAAKLLEFFSAIMSETERGDVLDTTVTAQVSDKLRTVEAVQPAWIEKWVGEWFSD